MQNFSIPLCAKCDSELEFLRKKTRKTSTHTNIRQFISCVYLIHASHSYADKRCEETNIALQRTARTIFLSHTYAAYLISRQNIYFSDWVIQILWRLTNPDQSNVRRTCYALHTFNQINSLKSFGAECQNHSLHSYYTQTKTNWIQTEWSAVTLFE